MTEPVESITPFSADPPRLLADANFNQHIVRGLRRIRPDITITEVRQVGLTDAPDPDILAYAAKHDLIVLTHDVRTMPTYFSPGVWYTPQRAPVGVVIQAILEAWLCSGHDEYRNRELRLP